jgi:hypothetical protein
MCGEVGERLDRSFLNTEVAAAMVDVPGAISTMQPSGRDFAVSSVPDIAECAALFSTMTGLPASALSSSEK